MILHNGDTTYRFWSFWQRGISGSFRYNSDGLGLGNGVYFSVIRASDNVMGGFRRLGWAFSSFLKFYDCIVKAVCIFSLNFNSISQHSCDLVPTMFLDLRQIFNLHLSALSDSNILDGFVRHVGSDVLDLSNNIHAIDHLSKDHVLAIEMR
jgi:hypothetical protein